MLLDKTRAVKIADFGVARVEASNPNDMTGETGTLGYMAPEVCGQKSAEHRTFSNQKFSQAFWYDIYDWANMHDQVEALVERLAL